MFQKHVQPSIRLVVQDIFYPQYVERCCFSSTMFILDLPEVTLETQVVTAPRDFGAA